MKGQVVLMTYLARKGTRSMIPCSLKVKERSKERMKKTEKDGKNIVFITFIGWEADTLLSLYLFIGP